MRFARTRPRLPPRPRPPQPAPAALVGVEPSVLDAFVPDPDEGGPGALPPVAAAPEPADARGEVASLLAPPFVQPGQVVGEEHYIGQGDPNTDGSTRFVTVADADGDGRPDVRLQRRHGGLWADVGLASPSTGAADATARAAAATAQGTADAALPNTGAALATLIQDPATSLKWRGGLTGEVLRTLLAHLADLAVSAKTFGAVGDRVPVTGAAALTSGTAALTVAGANFPASGAIVVPGAGAAGAPLVTTFTGGSGTTCTLAANASTTLSAVSTLVTYGTDDTVNLQKWLDYCRINRVPGYLPPGGYLTTASLVVTPPSTNSFWCVTLTGAGAGYDITSTNQARGESVIDATALVDQGAMLVSSGRGVTIRGIGLLGGNTAPTAAVSGAGLSVNPATDVEATWVSTGYRNTRYSPNAGIVIDPFRGTTPADGGYPGQTYNASYNATSQVHIADCTIRQFVVGILNSPSNSASLPQGDSIYMQHLKIYTCTVCYAAGQAQTKGCYLVRSAFGTFRAVLDSVTYGLQTGQPPLCSGLEIGNGFMLFRHNPGNGPIDLVNIYLEQCTCLGTAFTTSGAQSYVRLRGCYFKRGSNYLQAPMILEASCPVEFTGYMADSSATAVAALSPQTQQNAFNVTGAPFNFVSGTVDCRQADELMFGFVEAGLDNVRITDLRASGRDSSSSRRYAHDFVAPTSLSGRYNPLRVTRSILSTGQTYLYTPGTQFSRVNLGASVSNIVNPGTATMNFDLDAAGLLLTQVGDYMLWRVKGHLSPVVAQQLYIMPAYKVTGISGSTVTATACFDVTYYDATYSTFGVIIPEWAPMQALTGDIASGAATLLNVSPATILKNGDYVKGVTAGIQSSTRVLSGGGTASITLSKNATATVVGNVLYYGRLQIPTVTAAF